MPAIGATTAVEAIEDLLVRAVAFGASDIHIDPEVDGIRVRMRVDGLLRQTGTLPMRLHAESIARLKILSGARTDVHAVPQDGRWRADVSGSTYNIRASFMPSYHGENAVLRLLPISGSMGIVSLADLGFSSDHIASLDRACRQSSGLILVAGPTGSGKTTTLRACLAKQAEEPVSIMTLEDPVEYEIPGVRQIYVRHEHGVTFAGALRAALRQDPDIIMVGEIRDGETARVAIHTALTGHLVLSTIHTNSALEAVPRLIDMGVDPYLLASTLSLVVGQRLIRTICPSCAGMGAAVQEYQHDAARCGICHSTGWKGRSVIAEVLSIDLALKSLIHRKASLDECAAAARDAGFVDMGVDGADKVACGMTTGLEVRRVLTT